MIPLAGTLWQHSENGNIYKVECVTNIMTTRPDTFPVTVVYRSKITGYLWSGPLSEWLLKFEEVKT